MSLAIFLAALASRALAAEDPPPPPPASDSSADSKQSDWFGTNSGWQYERRFVGNTAPVGTFGLEYKHWFNSTTEPAAWTVHASPRKPTAANWDTAPDITNMKLTTSAAGSTAQSEWTIDPTSSSFGGFQIKINTRSKASATKPDKDAHSRTRVDDPWILRSPATDPNWDPTNPLDPQGNWSLGGNIGLFGTILGKDGSTGIGLSYSAQLGSIIVADAPFVLFSVEVTGQGASVYADPRLELFSNDTRVTVSALDARLESYLTATGWSLNPSFDFADYDPTNFSQLAEIFNVDMRLRLDSSTTMATVYTEHSSAADAATGTAPEPSMLALMAAGIGLLGYVRSRRNRQRQS